VGKLQAQQPCHLKVFSFPFYEYGSVPGHIRQISLSPDESGQYNLYVALGSLVEYLKGKRIGERTK